MLAPPDGIVLGEHPVDPVVERFLGVVEVGDVFAMDSHPLPAAGADVFGQIANESLEVGALASACQDRHRVHRLA